MIIDIYEYAHYVHTTIINISISEKNNQYLRMCHLLPGPMKTIRFVRHHFIENKGDMAGCLPSDELVALSSFVVHLIKVRVSTTTCDGD